jgi:hypothetical protein
MDRFIKAISISVALVSVAYATSTPAQQRPQICPAGYSLVGEVCINDKTGDMVLPAKPKMNPSD